MKHAAAQIFNSRGVDLANAKNYFDAISLFQRALSIDEVFFKAYYNLGSAFRLQGIHTTAVGYYIEALVLYPPLIRNISRIIKGLNDDSDLQTRELYGSTLLKNSWRLEPAFKKYGLNTQLEAIFNCQVNELGSKKQRLSIG
jgi:tetratricopeptide (TPR) repeat protein